MLATRSAVTLRKRDFGTVAVGPKRPGASAIKEEPSARMPKARFQIDQVPAREVGN